MKKRFSKIYTILAIAICMFAMASTAYGAYTPTSFSGYITHPTGTYRTAALTKSDTSYGYASYTSGASVYIRVEMWGSNEKTGDAKNYTMAHTEGSIANATYYNLYPGEYTMILNSLYETYNKTVYSTLLVTGYSTGTVTGKWSPMTNSY